MHISRIPCFLRWVVAVWLAMFCLVAQGKVFLVSVGIADYPGTRIDLRVPARDAKTISLIYYKNAPMKYRQLLDDKATEKNILNAMKELYAQAGEDDVVVFFFSGHGFRGGFYIYDGSLWYDQIRKAMAASKCKNKMIFADACYSGTIRTAERVDTTAIDHEAEMKKSNIMLFLSSRGNEVSLERPDMKNGYFTTYLGKGLKGAADANRDRVITARELYDYVHNGVVDLSKGMQHPVMWGNFPDEMIVMKWN